MDQTTTQVSQPKPVLVIDTNAFIRCLDIQKLGEKYDVYTSSNVLNEIRDKAAREKFNALNFDIKTYSADDKSFAFVEEFSKRTGDYASLSFTDKELIAIGVYLAHQRGKADKLRKQPPELTEWIPTETKPEDEEDSEEEEEDQKEAQNVDDDGFVTVTKGKQLTLADVKPKKEKKVETEAEQKQVDDDGFITVTKGKKETADETKEEEQEEREIDLAGTGKPFVEEGAQGGFVQVGDNGEGIVLSKISEKEGEQANVDDKAVEEESDDEDDGKGWINPDNISKKLYKGTKKEDRIQEIGIVIMTSDYAMQNVIIQIGLPLLSTEGYIIKQTRRFVLECYCCHKICKDPTKQFCPACGNPTLRKLSVRVNDDGLITFYRNPRKKVSTRGKIYSIPMSEGGRKNNDLLLREDEFLMKGRLQQLERQEKDKDRKFKQRLKDYENGLTFDDINLQHKYLSNKIQIGYGKVNPNDKNQLRKHKR